MSDYYLLINATKSETLSQCDHLTEVNKYQNSCIFKTVSANLMYKNTVLTSLIAYTYKRYYICDGLDPE